MNYEISADTARVLKMSRSEAARLHTRMVDTLCLMLGLLKEESIISALRAIGVNIDTLRNEAELRICRTMHKGNEQQTDFDVKEEEVALLPETERVMKLAQLEKKLTRSTGEVEVEHMMLALLRPGGNAARELLLESGVTYEKLAAQMGIKQNNTASTLAGTSDRTSGDASDTFQFADDEPDNVPNDANGTAGKNGRGAFATTQGKKGAGDTTITDTFGTDYTKLAAQGALDPVVGREKETQRLVQILCRRKKNNPVVIGAPGVGKSAIVEGLAQLIAARKVPSLLADKRIVALDMASIVAGTQYRGQFEERLRRLIVELKEHPEIVLFIDEIHTIIGAGSAPGSLDAANILKPALARGEVQCIGATTVDEYRKTIEKDGALERRFQKILVEPTSTEETLQILHNIKGRYEEHHNVTYTEEALEACVNLTARYITDRALPDKAIDALDEAGSRIHLADTDAPKEIAEKEAEVALLKEQKLEAAQAQDYERAANLRDTIVTMTAEIDRMTEEWHRQQRKHPQTVDAADVAGVVSMISGVPVTRVAESESIRLKGMKKALCERVIAQDKAVEKLVRAITRSRIGLKSADRPIGTFMFVGPTGVGKTHLVKCLAEWMFGSKDALITIDMSEYGEKYSVSRLVGAPPGYVGYEEGGQLTEKVRRKPYSVILLDEIEKAHSDVFNTLLQVMDEGRMTDGNGVTVDFRNTVIVLTSNSGTRQLREFGSGVGFNMPDEITGEQAEDVVMKTLKKQFAPEFLNRLDDVIMFHPLNRESAAQIADLELAELQKRIEKMGYSLTVTPEVRTFIVDKGFNAQYGARSLKRAIQQHLEDLLCDALMEGREGPDFEAVVENGKVIIK